MTMVKQDGGVLSRVTIAVASFHCRFGTWPSRMTTSRDFWFALSAFHLTEQGISRLSRIMAIELVDDPVRRLIVHDNAGHEHDYYTETIPDDIDTAEAMSWLGLERSGHD